MIFEDDIRESLKVLQSGGLILYPTDTVWGIGCDALNAEAVSKIYSLKNRSETKSMIILLDDEKDIAFFTSQQNLTIFDYIKGVQKPTTVVYEKARNLAPNLLAEDGSVGIRIVKDKFCKALIAAFGGPIVSTSSNVSGYPAPLLFQDIDNKIKSGVDYIVRYRQDDDMPGIPSAVVRLSETGIIQIIRP